jgi:hypothetical protein
MGAGDAARVRLWKATPPEELTLVSWRSLNEGGPGEEVTYTLVPKLDSEGETVAYDALFVFPPEPGHYYVQAFAIWPDEEGSGADQDAQYLMHVRLLDAA